MSINTTKPEIVIKNGKMRGVVLDIKDYERLLGALEEKEDLLELKRIKQGKTSFRNIDEYVKHV